MPKVEESSLNDGSSNLKGSTTETEIYTNELARNEDMDFLV